jgi:hypothetical protein
MKKYTSKLIIFTVFMLLSIMMVLPVHAMGRRPHPTSGGVAQGVPEPLTILSLLGIGVAGVGAYLVVRKKKDK